MRINRSNNTSSQPAATSTADATAARPQAAPSTRPTDSFVTPKIKGKVAGLFGNGSEPSLVKVDGQTPVYQEVAGASLIDQGVAPTDVDQGAIGDCFFLSSVASLAQRNPTAIQKMIKDNGDGTYSVTFYKPSKSGSCTPMTVTVDGKIPELKDSSGAQAPVYAESPDPKEIWPAIIEKAYAKFCSGSGYKTLDQGGLEADAMTALTGKPATSYDISPAASQALYDSLRSAIAAGKLTAAGTFSNADLKKNLAQLNAKGEATLPTSTTYSKVGLVDDHVYTILGVSNENGKPTIQLRNPWGTQGYHGAGKSDGEFSMPLADFAQLFQEVAIGG